jgi:pantoate--beta-alanine ligase
MIMAKTINAARVQVKEWKKQGLTVGLVPTMGYLHEGHLSLIKKAYSENDKVVVSVFVNPTQFGPNEDYDKYPKDLEKDRYLCEKTGAAMIFAPEASEMYDNTSCTLINIKKLTTGLCGAKRPGHFEGVCTIVSKLFNIITPDRAYFGKKDAQQLAVIKKLVKDLNFDIEIIGCPIVREADGLAKSSRNIYLSKKERKAALVLSKSLNKAKKALKAGENNSDNLFKIIISEINSEPLAKIDYVEIVDSETLEPTKSINTSILIAIAVFIGKTRLIDNFTWK